MSAYKVPKFIWVLAEAGATVVGTARTSSEIEQTVKAIEDAGGKGLALTADALKRSDSERVVQTAVDEFGRIDILVNNVGFATYGPFLNLTDDNLRQTFDYCVTSAFVMSQLAVPHMLKVGAGFHREHLVRGRSDSESVDYYPIPLPRVDSKH